MSSLTAEFEPSQERPAPAAHADPTCRLCGARLHRSLLDLGCLPLANRTVAAGEAASLYRLHIRICDNCNLAQAQEIDGAGDLSPPVPEMSSRSAACVAKAAQFAAAMIKRLRLNQDSLVMEVGSNDGYLLQHFQAAGIPVLGIEAAAAPAAVALKAGIPTEITAFTTETAMEITVNHGSADLVVANYVMEHAPDLFDFAAGFAGVLRPNGVVILQVPHLLSLVQRLQFDAFRHDTSSYLSLQVLERVLRSVGLRIFEAERVTDRGGSLRVHACHAIAAYAAKPGLKSVRQAEAFAPLDRRDFYAGFSNRVTAACDDIRAFLAVHRTAGRRIAACGAVARGASLLNIVGANRDLVRCVADPDPAKHGRCLPGSQIPIVPVEFLLSDPPDDVLILPWTNTGEAIAPIQPLRAAGVHFWTMLPRIMRV